MIKAIFFTRFHHERGPRVLHQVPEGSIIPIASASPTLQSPLFDFASVSDYIIPRQEFCDRLVTVCINHCRVIGYPVCIENARKYDRNQFIFNLALVLEEEADMSGYASVVRKLARMFRNLEEQSGFLSNQEEEEGLWDNAPENDTNTNSAGQSIARSGGSHDEAGTVRERVDLDATSVRITSTGGKVYALCEMILEDLNNYCECMIPIAFTIAVTEPKSADESNTINLKLFPTRPPPAPVHAWHVPLSTVLLSSLNISSDLTLNRIIPYIDGVSSVAQIAQLADTDLGLTRKAVAHLLYYGCVILLDIFQFGAIYAPTAEIGSFVEDEEAQEECRRYVSIVQYAPRDEYVVVPARDRKAGDIRDAGPEPSDDAGRERKVKKELKEVDCATLVHLFSSLKQGVTLSNWCLERTDLLLGIDIRRFITFGVIKGFLYRVHRYAIATGGHLTPNARNGNTGGDRDYRKGNGRGGIRESSVGRDLPLARYLDGMHCFDEICTELQMSEREVLSKIKSGYGEVQTIYR